MRNRMAALTLSLLFTCTAHAHGPKAPAHQQHPLGDLKLDSGQPIEDFSISYVTHGKLNEKKSTAVLMVSALGGYHHRIDHLPRCCARPS